MYNIAERYLINLHTNQLITEDKNIITKTKAKAKAKDVQTEFK